MIHLPGLRPDSLVASLFLATCLAGAAHGDDGVSIADAPGGGKTAGWTTPPPPTVRRVSGPARPQPMPRPESPPTVVAPTPPSGFTPPAPALVDPWLPADAPPVVAPAPQAPVIAAPAPGTRRRSVAAARGATRNDVPPVTFRFAVGDVMRISIWDDESQTGTIDLEQRVLRDGTVTPIWLEPVRVAGLSIQEVRDLLVDRYLLYYEPPIRITIAVVSVHAERAFVLGEVGAPTAIELTGPTTALQALAQAGSAIPGVGDLERVKLIRNCEGCGSAPRVYTLNLSRTLVGRGRTVTLQPGDVLYVPTRGVINWTRDLGAVLAPLGNLLGSVGSAATTYLAIDEAGNNNGN
ncbi:MAG: polysaccharide biosynthesis/export family protein [Planctomycetes bacterium]|nr:polysaccharide biosynthesis/export family protein [Planctomycetota bacterium]